MSGFTVSGGKILDPSGNAFIAKGINLYDSQMGQASDILAAFPGLNMVRVAVQNYASAAAMTAFVNTMTARGVVVEIEDHVTSGGSNNNVLTGSALTKETSWYSSIATAFKGNDHVWFGTMNEPDDTSNQAATTNQEVAIYNAIRGAGNTNPIMMSMIGGFSTTVSGGLTASAYASMTNIIWDAHFYNWQTNHNGAQAASALQGEIANAQLIHSADGTVPVIIGEYGSSQSDLPQVEQAVQGSGFGSLAWAWHSSWASLSPTGTGTALTTSGKETAAYIASGTPTPTPTPTPSPNDTVVTGVSGSITDNAGHKWTITAGAQVAVDGTTDGATNRVTKLAWVNNNIWQENTQNLWYEKVNAAGSWGPPGGNSTSPLPAGTAATVAANIVAPDIQFMAVGPSAPAASMSDLAVNQIDTGLPPLSVGLNDGVAMLGGVAPSINRLDQTGMMLISKPADHTA